MSGSPPSPGRSSTAGSPGVTGLSIDLGPLVRDPSLRLPARTRFVTGLAKLEGRLRRAALAGYGAIFQRAFIVFVRGKPQGRGYPGRKEALDELKAELNDLHSGLRRYLAVEIDPALADQVFRAAPLAFDPAGRTARSAGLAVRSAFVSQPLLLTSVTEMLARGGSHFSTLAQGHLLGKTAVDVDRFEASMTPEIAELAFASERMMAKARAMYELWFRLVRVSLAAVVVRALPYKEIWRSVYGTAGYTLSLQVGKLADEITASRAYAELQAAASSDQWMDAYVSLGAGSAGSVPFPLAETLDSVGPQAESWRNSCRLGSCPPATQGTEQPFDFDPIAPSLHSNPALAGPLPDHMFARLRAQERAALASRHWDWLKEQVLQLSADAVRFRINAGSLEHGGAHPPHATHRNGSMFDLGLGRPGEFAFAACSAPIEIAISEPVIRPESARDNPGAFLTIREIVGALESLFSLRDEPEDKATADAGKGKRFILCAGEFEFPAGGLRSVSDVPVPYAEIALRFTQAMLLTFPSQILYARWATLRDAQADLIDRVDAAAELLAKDGRPLTGEENTAIAFFRAKLGKKPPVRLPTSASFGVLFQRDDHADHWHLSYRPDDVEVSDSDRDTALTWLEENRELLWPPA